MAKTLNHHQSTAPQRRDAHTPAMRQWADHKAQVGDALLLFRMGDFYETFHEDARTAARVLGLTLTQRDRNIPLAGIPYHALDTYLAKLVAAGLTVAISEQTEDPKQAKGVVKREVVRIVTPGTVTEDNLLQGSSNNYIAALCAVEKTPQLGMACVDLAVGDFFTLRGAASVLLTELARLDPSEVLISEQAPAPVTRLTEQLCDQGRSRMTRRPDHEFDPYHCERRLHEQFQVATLEGFGYPQMEPALLSAGALLAYLQETQKTALGHITALRPRAIGDHVQIDPSTWRALEIERTLRSGSEDGSLYAAVNRTLTRMGARRLREVLRFPLRDRQRIVERQDAVEEFRAEASLLAGVRSNLNDICDIERITARLGLGRCSPRDLEGLGRSLQAVERIADRLAPARSTLLKTLENVAAELIPLQEFLHKALAENAPLTVREGGIIAAGYSAELDRLRLIGHDGKQWLAQYQARQIQRTRIPSLKVGFNKVFGYYIEVTHTHKSLVPEDYVRKQTIKNAERYITDELKAYETEVLTAEEQARELEYRLFEEIKAQAAEYICPLQANARAISMIDLLAGFAVLANDRRYCRPRISDEPDVAITDGRHPVLEQTLGHEFVPNDAHLDASSSRLLLITGPNMSGKSTYIRQVALLVLLAQTGSYVPAKAMQLGAVDRLFARIGASDELTRGQSTFMVEMIEAANILNNAGEHSLVILDELGRGTSTYDGLSLAWAICEHIARRIRCRTLFATHYHELTELAHLLPAVKNYNVAVREWPAEAESSDKIVFLHKIVEGATDKSYGVHVAQIAGIPASVLARSRQVLHHLESGLSRSSLRAALTGEAAEDHQQLELFAVQEDRLRQALLEVDIDRLTPLEALQVLKLLQDEAR